MLVFSKNSQIYCIKRWNRFKRNEININMPDEKVKQINYEKKNAKTLKRTDLHTQTKC